MIRHFRSVDVPSFNTTTKKAEQKEKQTNNLNNGTVFKPINYLKSQLMAGAIVCVFFDVYFKRKRRRSPIEIGAPLLQLSL
ncbi:hypothetical protein [Mucilaginibacter myungsuensis]|uniref:Uncharacterized protein n=1 Tax=Mucilaginibacter myungsuensis TaxID=649104 RepID=A0A929PWW7_9SPHI|nr:hypothetical protein [Mucilaginibacter myungsuensis]MBE9661612.1 hypothetical protein [Mucilaginibacter myungsuensis]